MSYLNLFISLASFAIFRSGRLSLLLNLDVLCSLQVRLDKTGLVNAYSFSFVHTKLLRFAEIITTIIILKQTLIKDQYKVT